MIDVKKIDAFIARTKQAEVYANTKFIDKGIYTIKKDNDLGIDIEVYKSRDRRVPNLSTRHWQNKTIQLLAFLSRHKARIRKIPMTYQLEYIRYLLEFYNIPLPSRTRLREIRDILIII